MNFEPSSQSEITYPIAITPLVKKLFFPILTVLFHLHVVFEGLKVTEAYNRNFRPRNGFHTAKL